MEIEKELYTVEETAKFLSIQKPLVFKLIKQEKLPAINLGSGQRNIYRIKKEDIYNLINNKKENVNTRPSKNKEDS